MVKRQIVQKLLEDMQAAAKKNAISPAEHDRRVNTEFYPAYREIVETIKMLLGSDPHTFQLSDELIKRIDLLHHTVTVVWAPLMRRCRVGPVRELVQALKTFSTKGPEAMAYLVSRKSYLSNLYDMVYHIKYESCDHAMVEECCRIIRAKTRNPEHENHNKWIARVERAIEDVSSYDEKMAGFAHGNQYKDLPTNLMLRMLNSLKADPSSGSSVSFDDVQSL